MTVSDQTPIILELQEEQSQSSSQSPPHPNQQHDTDPSTSWLSFLNDYTDRSRRPS